MKIIEKIIFKDKKIAFVLSLVSMFMIFYLDYLTGTDFDIKVVYIIPVLFITLNFKPFVAYMGSVIAASGSYVTDIIYDTNQISRIASYFHLINSILTFFIIVFILTILKKSYETERELARYDNLTGIPNQRYFFEFGEAEIERAKRFNQKISIAFIDCDNFKKINDKYGHLAADTLLIKISHVMKESIRKIDFIARIGGDEFAILLPQTDLKNAEIIIKRLKINLEKGINHKFKDVTFSIGVAVFNVPPNTLEKALHEADNLMYKVKSLTKNGIEFMVFDM